MKANGPRHWMKGNNGSVTTWGINYDPLGNISSSQVRQLRKMKVGDWLIMTERVDEDDPCTALCDVNVWIVGCPAVGCNDIPILFTVCTELACPLPVPPIIPPGGLTFETGIGWNPIDEPLDPFTPIYDTGAVLGPYDTDGDGEVTTDKLVITLGG